MCKDLAGSRALDLVPDYLKATVENSNILYAPKPFKWMSTAHSTPLGHTIVTEGLEVPIDELGYEKSKLKRYPMVWTNPQTGEKCKHSSVILLSPLTCNIYSLAGPRASCVEALSEGFRGL